MPFGLGRPVRSTLTLLILVPVLSPAPHAYTSSPALLHTLERPQARQRGPHPRWIRPPSGILQVDSHSARERLANNHGAENYGRRCPEGMLGVASALPDTRTFTA